MMNTYCSRAPLNRIFYQFLSMGITTLSLLLGLVPNLAGRSPTLVFSSSAYADTYSPGEIKSVAQAILESEPFRQSAYNKIKEIIGTTPDIACYQPQSLQSLPENAKGIAINFCGQYQKIVESMGLNSARFNQIVTAAQNDQKLYTQIQEAMVKFQNGK